MTDIPIERLPGSVHTLQDLFLPAEIQSFVGGSPVRAVPPPYHGGRWRAAWWVLTGRAFAIRWPRPGDFEIAVGEPESAEDLRNMQDLLVAHCDAATIAKITLAVAYRRKYRKSLARAVEEAGRRVAAARATA